MTEQPSGDNTRKEHKASTDITDTASLRDALRRVQARLDTGTIPRAEIENEDEDESLPQPEEDTEDDEVETGKLPARPVKREKRDGTLPRLGEKVDRDVRQTLRRVQQHLIDAQVALGAQHDTVDLTEVIYHETNRVSSLNYVTPRRKTAWVSSQQIQHGIDYLKAKGRRPRIQFIEGLYPPIFAQTLSKLNLEVESETPLMIYLQAEDAPTPEKPDVQLPYDVRLERVQDVRGMEVWWYVWRNAHFDVFSLGVEPVFVGRDMANVAMGQHIDIVAYRDQLPFGVARVTVQNKTAHIVSLAVFREMRSTGVMQLIVHRALTEALERGCDVVFMPGDNETDREASRELGFMDFGSIVCYAAKPDNGTPSADKDDDLAQPILDIKGSGDTDAK
jgi:GNAT superfamily N-acetyltransferase